MRPVSPFAAIKICAKYGYLLVVMEGYNGLRGTSAEQIFRFFHERSSQ